MRTKIITLLVLCASALTWSCNKGEDELPGGTGNDHSTSTSKSCQLRTDMRVLWEDHITYTRNVICCLVDDLPGKDQALNRLMKNQEDIGGAVGTYYGDVAGDKLTQLLKTHIGISADVVLSAKAGNQPALDAANARWVANADSIAQFLADANPNWKFEDMKAMMRDHLTLTTNEAVARINRNYQADIEAYDAVHVEILHMADMLAVGIEKQFPDKF